MQTTTRLTPAAIALLAFAFFLHGCSRENAADGRPRGSGVAATSSTFTAEPPRYVGIEPCAECHRERVDEYRRSNHWMTLRAPDDGTLHGRFDDGANILSTRDPSLRFEMTKKDGEHFIAAITDNDGASTRQEHRIDLVIGSGKIFEGYMTWKGDELFQLPVGHWTEGGEWANCPGFDDGVARFDRRVKPRCLDCHGTWLDAASNDENRYVRDTAVLGMSCERCHGMANNHVAWHRSNPGDQTPHHIVEPRELDRHRRLDQCGQCHGDPGVLKQPAFSYVPGTPLENYVTAGSKSGEVFVHTSNQVQRLRSSKCFTPSNKLECITCHDPHLETKEALISKSVAACASCHATEPCGGSTDLAPNRRDECIACHMPRRSDFTTTIATAKVDDLDIARMIEHRIGIWPDAARWARVTWLDAEGTDAEARRAARSDHLSQTLEEALALRVQRQYPRAASLLRRLRDLLGSSSELEAEESQLVAARIAADQASALCAEALGVGATGGREESKRILERAMSLDPGHPDVRYNLGLLALDAKDAKAAADHFATAAAIFADKVEVRYHYGAALVASGDMEGANREFDAALAIDADHPNTLLDAARLRFVTGRPSESEPLLRRLLAKRTYDLEAKELLGRVLAASSRPDEAIGEFESILRIDDERPAVHCALSEALARKNRLVDAEKHVRRALELSPEMPEAHHALSMWLARTGRMDEALAAAADALLRRPDYIEALVLTSDLDAAAGRKKDALRTIDEALRIAREQGRADLVATLEKRRSELE